MKPRQLAQLALVATLAAASVSSAAPVMPADDQVIVETLPALPAWRRDARAAPGRSIAGPRDAAEAARRAAAYLQQARSEGDARLAGLALGVLESWRSPMQDPAEVVLMQATLAQHVHEFDRAEALLDALVSRGEAGAQAWLTLATVRRVRGDLRGSDRACAGVMRAGEAIYGAACAAENLALRGERGAARAELGRLLALPAAAALRAWLLTTLAGVDELAGAHEGAERAYRAAIALGAEGYAQIALADLLLDRGRAAEVPGVLAGAARSDAVLLRLALAARALSSADAPRLAAEFGARLRAAAQRGEGGELHLREHARFVLELEGDSTRALALARRNLARQREPADLLLFARAAVAGRDRDALAELDGLMKRMGVRDERVTTRL